MLNELFGPSIHLLILDMFLENPKALLNLRSIAKKVNKNPGSISRVLPILVDNEFLEQTKIGKTTYVYCLKEQSEKVKLTLEFYEKLKTINRKTNTTKNKINRSINNG
jgi:DNA-binding transcriptional regulator YhcF (GntR family)